MSAADTGLLDVALPASTEVETQVDATEVDTPVDGVETTEVDGAESTDGGEGSEKGGDKGGEKGEDSKGGEKESTPQSVRQALKQFRDADPANAKIAKELHNNYERSLAYQKEFPGGVNEARELKTFMSEIGGKEGWEAAQATIENINQTDELLYRGDTKELIGNIVEDLKEQGLTGRLVPLAQSLVEALSQADSKGFDTFRIPILHEALKQAELPNALVQAYQEIKSGNTDAAMKTLTNAWKWTENLGKQAADAKKGPTVTPEQEKFQKEKADWEAGKKKEFNNAVGTDCERYNNKALGAVLKTFLSQPFFKAFPRETLIDLGNGIKANLYKTLEGDSTYQKQMKSMWSAKTPDAAKIKEYHNAKLDSIADKIVRGTIQARYPNYAKGGQAAGRVAAAAEKTKADASKATKSVQSGQPIFVAQKPRWESIDWSKDPKQLLFIAGKAYLKPVGKTPGRFVTWRK